MKTSCKDCGREWSGYAECHCRKCHVHFGGVSGFDAHFNKGSCATPPTFNKDGKPLFHLLDKKYGKTWCGVVQHPFSDPKVSPKPRVKAESV